MIVFGVLETTSTVTIAISTSHRNKLATTQIASTVSPSQEGTKGLLKTCKSTTCGCMHTFYGTSLSHERHEGFLFIYNKPLLLLTVKRVKKIFLLVLF